MRILHVITSLQYGGAEKLVADIVPMLKNKGNDIDVVAFDNSEPNFSKLLDEKGIKVIFFGKGYYSLRFLFRLGKMMKDYDIVHTHNTSPQYFAAIASLWNRKCKLVYTEHNTVNRMRNIAVFSFILKWIFKRYDKIICISDKAEENLRNYLLPTIPSSSAKILTIYNGVDVQKFHNAKPIERMHPEGKTVVAMVAGFRPQKDQDTLIRAFKHLPSDKYELWLVGDGKRKTDMEKLVSDLNLSNSVKFLGIRTDIPELLHTADIIVMSSHYEGLSLSSVEGMSVGKPFIASDVDGLHEVVTGYGLLVPQGDHLGLASEIVRLAEDKEYYQQVANKCWERAQMFDIKEMVNGYQKVYESIILN